MGSVLVEEQEPLLRHRLDSVSPLSEVTSAAVEEFLGHRPVEKRWWVRLVAWESRLLWILSGSSIVIYVCNYMLCFTTLMFAGQLGTIELAGASISSVGIQGLAFGIMVYFINNYYILLLSTY